MDPRVKALIDLTQKQSTLNRVMAEKQLMKKQGFIAAPQAERTLEEEMADINQLRIELLTSLKKVLRQDVVAEFVSNLNDESVQFVSQVLPDFLTEIKRFNTTRLDANFLQTLLSRYSDKYARTKGISIPMESGDLASIKLDTELMGDLRRALVVEGIATPTAATEFVSKLKPEELATIDVGGFIEYLKRSDKHTWEPTSLIAIYRGFIGSKEIRDRADAFPTEKVSEAAYAAFKKDEAELEKEAFGAESDITKAREAIALGQRNMKKMQIDIDGLMKEIAVINSDVAKLENRYGKMQQKLKDARAALATTGLGKAAHKKNSKITREIPTKLVEIQVEIDKLNESAREKMREIREVEEIMANTQSYMELNAGIRDDVVNAFAKMTPKYSIEDTLARIRYERDNPPQEAPTVEGEQDKDDPRFYGFGVKRKVRMARYAPFGNKLIHLPSLDEGFLKICFPSFIKHPKIPEHKMSPHLHKAMMTALQKGRIEPASLRHVQPTEKRLLHKICTLAKVDNPVVIEEDEDDVERFEMLKGIIAAGNDNPALIKELKQLIVKLSHRGYLNKQTVNDALLEIMALE